MKASLFLCAIALVLSGCFSPMDYTPPGGDTGGVIRITLPGAARAVNPEALSYSFEFRGPGGETLTRKLEPPATSLSLSVSPGQWTIRAAAFTAGGIRYAEGEAAALVEAGEDADVIIFMTRLSSLLTSIAEVPDWIARAVSADSAAGSTPDSSILLPVYLNLADEADGWAALLSAIQTADKYVALDLSACAMNGMTAAPGEFDPGAANTGERLIVSLVLPDEAGSIKAGTSGDGTFRRFTALKTVNGANITAAGNYAFYRCTALAAVNLPAVTSIGNFAFPGCTALTTVSFPAAETIGEGAFASSIALATVNLPAAETIGKDAFFNCRSLTTVSFPAAETIGVGAFDGSIVLTSASLPAAETIGKEAFQDCPALATVDLSAATSIGERAFSDTGTTALALTLGSTPPTVGKNMFSDSPGKSVTVKVPSGATGYGTVPFDNGDTSADNWGNAFRGKGWDGTSYLTGTVNGNITLTIEATP